MFKILRKLFGKKELEPDQDIQEILDQQKQDREKHDRYMENRYLIKDAAVKGDIEAVKEMIKIETHPVQKHELYHLAFHAAYEEKDRPSALIISEQIGTLYFKFFENNPTVVGESRYIPLTVCLTSANSFSTGTVLSFLTSRSTKGQAASRVAAETSWCNHSL